MNREKMLLFWLTFCSLLIIKPMLVQATNTVASGWLGTEDILFTINVSSPSGTANEWVIGENVTVDFLFQSYQQHWGYEWEYPLKIHRLEIEISGAGISHNKTIATDRVLHQFEYLRHTTEVKPAYSGEITGSIDISFESNDLAHEGWMDERQERFTFPIAVARLTTYDNLYDNYASSQSNISSLQNQLNNIKTLMYAFVASTIILLFTTIYFATRKSKVGQ